MLVVGGDMFWTLEIKSAVTMLPDAPGDNPMTRDIPS